MRIIEFLNRWKIQILCVMGGFLLYAALVYSGIANSDVSVGYLVRGDYGEDARTYEFLVDGPWDTPIKCQVEISPLQYSEEQAQTVFAAIMDHLEEQIKGNNESLTRVESNLVLPTSFPGGIRAVWQSDVPDVLNSYGEVRTENCPEEGVQIWLTVELRTEVSRAVSTFPVRVFPKALTDEQKIKSAIETAIQMEDRNDVTDMQVMLPESYEGYTLRYRQEDSDYRVIPFLGILLAGLLYVRDQREGEEERKKRRTQLALEYADVVYQLMVFVGAGLTVARAWERIVRNYEERRRENRCGVRLAYEEMVYTQAQLDCGTPEGQAIVEFGKRCQLQSYLKLGSLLEQNRRTGTKNLTQLLQQEMTSAWEQQKNIARRLGEEAGTKLLLPLLLMLLVVMVIIMVPAMLSMQ